MAMAVFVGCADLAKKAAALTDPEDARHGVAVIELWIERALTHVEDLVRPGGTAWPACRGCIVRLLLVPVGAGFMGEPRVGDEVHHRECAAGRGPSQD